ncbi:AraC family transcriptional regulator [Verticiella sediminum]|uniref:AraC family transcriptional regulator n=1 Tax=Verticiella sediminum TaxID=1247510 RepID=A0A556AVE7_9BURK|nr:AraC family transcriptional regulator [Verticiella sediminum]TSH96928.1 AraC family transcriptional regulator [Verticiella sediminum]
MHRTPPDIEPRIHTAQRVVALVTTLAEDGVEPARVLADSGIDPHALRAPETRVSYRQMLTVYRNALHLAPDPTVALRAGARMHLTSFGMYGYALLSSPTFAEATDFIVKYHTVATPGLSLDFSREGALATYRYEILLPVDPADELYRFILELAFSAHLALARDLRDSAYNFSEVHVSYAQPAHASAYRMLFHCPVRFGQPANELRIDAAAELEAPARRPDASTHAMARELCQQLLVEMAHAGGAASMVRRALVEQMPWRFPTIESMARELSMEPRTLRRRLEGQGTSYREVLAEVRRGLAIEYLRKTRMTTEEIAARLGYSDAANFRHAFKGWTGKSPHEYRST